MRIIKSCFMKMGYKGYSNYKFIFIWGGISLEIRSEITLYGSADALP